MKVGGCPFIYQAPSSRWTKMLMNGLQLQTRSANTRKRIGRNEEIYPLKRKGLEGSARYGQGK